MTTRKQPVVRPLVLASLVNPGSQSDSMLLTWHRFRSMLASQLTDVYNVADHDHAMFFSVYVPAFFYRKASNYLKANYIDVRYVQHHDFGFRLSCYTTPRNKLPFNITEPKDSKDRNDAKLNTNTTNTTNITDQQEQNETCAEDEEDEEVRDEVRDDC